jgi:hypothetical protein
MSKHVFIAGGREFGAVMCFYISGNSEVLIRSNGRKTTLILSFLKHPFKNSLLVGKNFKCHLQMST